MPVLLQSFALSVTLRKLVHRENSMAGATSAKQQAIDITPYLSENDSVRTVKSLAQPGGGFTITIADQVSVELQDTIYALFEPMDMIEIRAARRQQDFVDQRLPIIMRGFITTIERGESIGDDGTPQRQIVVRGIDSGRLWQINQVLFQFVEASGVSFLDQFAMQSAAGLDGGVYPVNTYMQKLVDFVNTKVKRLAAYGKQMVPTFKLEATVPQGNTWIQGLGGKQGPIWTYVEAFVDRPWNECFIVDEEDGPHIIFRPVPYRDLTGGLIMDGAVEPGTIDVSAVEVLNMVMIRTETRIGNFFWVPPSSGMAETSGGLTAAALANAQPLDATYENNSPTLYGERLMETETHLMPTEVTIPPSRLPPADRDKAGESYITWNLLRGAQLKAMNRDNSVLEEGSATVNGRETFHVGRYIRLTRGSVVSEAYCNQVAHTFTPFRAWTTSLGLERGMGFYNRDQATNVPFFAEGRDGPYSPARKMRA